MSSIPEHPEDHEQAIDDRLGILLEKYLADVQSGKPDAREALLADNPDIADRLADCLDGLALFFGANSAADPARSTVVGAGQGTNIPSIAGYKILGQLGSGGMGIVYEAREIALDRIVALKVMRFGVVDPAALQRFRREAETAGALHHTNIVPVYATGREGDASWYAMQRIEGVSLSERIQTGLEESRPASIQQICDFGTQAAEALEHAHRRDVVHRDVKPANLIVDDNDRVWLADFGLARRLVDVGAAMTGAMLGTPRYMSPEQAALQSENVDHRTDIYSLGATLFELATGQPPFGGKDTVALITQIRYDDPPAVCSVRADLSRDLNTVLGKCLEKSPKDRYQTAQALADDLRAIGQDRAILARPLSVSDRVARWLRKRKGQVRITVTAALCTVAFIVTWSVLTNLYRNENRGQFRLRAAGGPYKTRITPISDASAEATSLTVPMEQHLRLPAGDYRVNLAPRGRWSRDVSMRVEAGQKAELKLSALPGARREVSLAGVDRAAVVDGIDGPAVLRYAAGILTRRSSDPAADWDLVIDNIPVHHCELPVVWRDASFPATRADNGTRPTKLKAIHFGLRANQAMHATWPGLAIRRNKAAAVMALQSPIDLDGDSRSDTVVSALNATALMAVDAEGRQLWARVFEFYGGMDTSLAAQRWLPSYPRVLSLDAIDDLNGDGIRDLAALFVRIQIGVRVDVCIATVSGRDGELIAAVRPASISGTGGAPWPVPGIFHTAMQRNASELNFGGTYANRSPILYITPSRVGGKTTDPFGMLYPSPLTYIPTSKRLIYSAGSLCHIYDAATLQVASDMSFSAGSAPLGTMRLAKLGRPAGHLANVFVTQALKRETCDLLVYENEDLLWQKTLPRLRRSEVAGLMNKPDWPLAVDLDGDGSDELIVPSVSAGKYHRRSGLRALDVHTGEDKWDASLEQFRNLADMYPSRMVAVNDVDGDGWREVAVASVAGPNLSNVGLVSAPRVGAAFVFVDWISGKTGRRMSWARHAIPIVGDSVVVAEIDAIRRSSEGEQGSVEVDFVTGDQAGELGLDSACLRFAPGHSAPTQVAWGITRISKGNSSAPVYQRRPGPYSDGDLRLTFLPEPENIALRMGESRILKAWESESGVQYAAVQNHDSLSIAVVRVSDMSTVWQFRSTEFDPLDCLFLDGQGGQDGRIFVQGHRHVLKVLDAETGREIWTLSRNPTGKLVHAESYQTSAGRERILLVQSCRKSDKRRDAFALSVVDAATGRLLWAVPFLARSDTNTPTSLDVFEVRDVTGDGIPDIIGPDQVLASSELELCVWDGKNGKRLWSTPRRMPGHMVEYHPGASIPIEIRGTVLLVTIEQNTARQGADLVLRDARTGLVQAREALGGGGQLLHISRQTTREAGQSGGNGCVALLPSGQSPRSEKLNRICVAYPGVSLNAKTFDVSERGFQLVKDYSDLAPTNTFQETWLNEEIITGISHEAIRATWLHDVNGDSSPELIIARQNQLSCYSLIESQELWSIDLAQTDIDFRIRWMDESEAFGLGQDALDCYSMKSGQWIGAIKSPFARSRILLGQALPNTTGDQHLEFVMPTPAGIQLVHIGAPSTTAPVHFHGRQDPRWIARRFVGLNRANATFFRYVLQSTFAALCLIVLPLAYVGFLVRRHRWSLAQWLLAPLLVMLWLVVWKANLLSPIFPLESLRQGLLTLCGPVTILLVCRIPNSTMLRGRGFAWRFLLVSSVVLYAVILLIAQWLAQPESGVVTYLHWQSLIWLIYRSGVNACVLYWIVRLVVQVWSMIQVRWAQAGKQSA